MRPSVLPSYGLSPGPKEKAPALPRNYRPIPGSQRAKLQLPPTNRPNSTRMPSRRTLPHCYTWVGVVNNHLVIIVITVNNKNYKIK